MSATVNCWIQDWSAGRHRDKVVLVQSFATSVGRSPGFVVREEPEEALRKAEELIAVVYDINPELVEYWWTGIEAAMKVKKVHREMDLDEDGKKAVMLAVEILGRKLEELEKEKEDG